MDGKARQLHHDSRMDAHGTGFERERVEPLRNNLRIYEDGETEFSGSIRYMQEWLGAESKQTVFNTLEKLIKRGLVQKRTEVLNGVRHNYYLASPRGSPKIRPPSPNFRPGVVQNLDHPSPNFRPNNIEDNITDILVIKDGGTRANDPRLDTDLRKIVDAYEANIGTWPHILTPICNVGENYSAQK